MNALMVHTTVPEMRIAKTWKEVSIAQAIQVFQAMEELMAMQRRFTSGYLVVIFLRLAEVKRDPCLSVVFAHATNNAQRYLFALA